MAEISQVALSVSDAVKSHAFYTTLFAMEHVGGTDAFKGEVAENVQGMQGASSVVEWFIDDRPFFQLELFQFDSPTPVAFASKRTVTDIGYSYMTFETPDLQNLRDACEEFGVEFVGDALDDQGVACIHIKDPDGVLIKVAEARSPTARNRITQIGLTVDNLEKFIKSYTNGLDCRVTKLEECVESQQPDGTIAVVSRAFIDSGQVETVVSQYHDITSKPWPQGYKINDYGILNIAFGFRKRAPFTVIYDAMCEAGFIPNCVPFKILGLSTVTYLNDPQGFSVEILHIHPILNGAAGFKKSNVLDRFILKLSL